MEFIYEDVDKLDGIDLVGSGQCVALVQHYTTVGNTETWGEGDSVLKNSQIKKGTAIATFEGGEYKSKAHGNHAAFYVSQDASGITVIDQWAGDEKNKPKVSKRYIRSKGTNKDGNYIDPSNNADAFSIIKK